MRQLDRNGGFPGHVVGLCLGVEVDNLLPASLDVVGKHQYQVAGRGHLQRLAVRLLLVRHDVDAI